MLLLGSGTTGLALLETLVGAGNVVVDDPNIIERLREADIPWIRAPRRTSRRCGRPNADRARIISSTIRRSRDNRRLLEFAGGVPVLVRVFDEQDADWIRRSAVHRSSIRRPPREEMMRWFDGTVARSAAGPKLPSPRRSA